MSKYYFIASDYELPLIYNSKEKIITVRDAIKLGIQPHEFFPWEGMDPNEKMIFFENKSDLGELVIRKGTEFEKNVRWYSDKPFIYSVDFRYTESRAKQLLVYIKENIIEGHELELWSIWLDDKKSTKHILCNYDELSLSNIKEMYDWKCI